MKHCRCLKNLVLLFLFLSSSSTLLHANGDPEVARWEREAGNVTIIRDDWGIAHVYGKTDADAVFGMIYVHLVPHPIGLTVYAILVEINLTFRPARLTSH